ncbi:MAG: endonuclease/exonuclease/phosphatase family protein [Dongiaceae bacterium]
MAKKPMAAAGGDIRVGTFNVENLFARYRFRSNFDPTAEDGFTINNLAFDIYDETDKQITALAIKKANADVLCLQEVESLPVLDRFNSRYLAGEGYVHRVLVDGNDPRHIDVAVLSRYPIANVRSHRHERDANDSAALFSRDCLEVDIDAGGRLLVLYVNHFKSMMGGRKETRPRRIEQVNRVKQIVEARWKPGFDGNFVVLGDFNDYIDGASDAVSSVRSLVEHGKLVNVLRHLDKNEQWTHYFAGGKKNEKTKQLDYLMVGKGLFQRAGSPRPEVVRDGLPFRAVDYVGPRFPGVGDDNPKASDHCPLTLAIPFSALTQ